MDEIIGNNPISMEDCKTKNCYNFFSLIENENEECMYTNIDINSNYYEEQEFCSKFSNNKNDSILSLNIQSLSSKFNDFKEFLTSIESSNFNFSIISLQEIYKIVDKEYFNIDNLIFVFKQCSNSNGGGMVSILILILSLK